MYGEDPKLGNGGGKPETNTNQDLNKKKNKNKRKTQTREKDGEDVPLPRAGFVWPGGTKPNPEAPTTTPLVSLLSGAGGNRMGPENK